MWKLVDGKLIQTADTSRVKFRTNISKSLLEQWRHIAEENNTHVNYLLETGLKKLLDLNSIQFDTTNRPKDRVQYKTTYDKELLEAVKEFAKENNVYVNDIIEYSGQYMQISDSKTRDYKHRISE